MNGEHKYLTFKTSTIHGTGAFARRKIRSGTKIIEYIGEKLTKKEAVRQLELDNGYIFTIDEDYDLNGAVDWNPARFINHGCEPNCEAVDYDGHIWIVATRTIHPGEELTYNYGYDLEDWQEHPCQCRARTCLGYMIAEELFPVIRRRLHAGAGAGKPAPR